MLDAILWVLRTGAPWRDLPADFGPWSTAWDFFDKWTKDGTFDEVLRRLRQMAIPNALELNFSGMVKLAFIHRYLRLCVP